MEVTKNSVLQRAHSKPIILDTFLGKNVVQQPVVVFCHGYKGFKDWGAWELMAKQIAASGFCVVTFNFSHNGGTVTQPKDFPDLEAFGQNNYTKELEDLRDVLDWIQLQFKDNSYVNTDEIYLIGHSRGGGISVLKTAEDQRIKKLITLASVSDFGRRTATSGDLEEWQKRGVKFVLNGRTQQQMPHYYQFYEDFVQNKDRLNIQKAAEHITVPVLIIHGEADTSVTIDEAYALHQWNTVSEFYSVKGADHVFNIRHPWHSEVPSKTFQEVIDKMIAFLKR